MRIEKIKFKNINSLKGEHEVNFGANPLKSSGIFAIIGPTGSGKSTLLDVITLSLYNRVPRIAKAITDTVVEATGTVLTRFADEAYASIEYSTADGSFISTWSIRRNRNGKLVSPHMELIDKKDGKPMDLKKSEVPGQNEELIGLNYDQFVKSIILSQGEFSKFLKADKNERGTLLEKITGTGIYRSIGRKVYERYVNLKRDIETAESKSEMIQLLSDEQIKEIEKQSKAADKQQAVLEKQLIELQSTKKTKELILDFQAQAKANAELLIQGEKKEIALNTQLKALAIHEQLSPFVAGITLHKEAKTKSLKVQAETDALKTSITKDEVKHKEVIKQMGDLVKSAVTAENFIEEMKAFEAKITKMDNDLDTMKTLASKIVAEVKQDAQNQSYASAHAIALKSKSSEFQTIIESRKIDLRQYLKEVNLDPNTKPDSLINMLNETKKELEGLKEKQAKTLLRDTLQKDIKTLKDQSLQIEKKLKENQPLLDKVHKTLLSDKESIVSIRKQKEKSQLRYSMKDARATLVEGEPCPLCGATHHPDAHSEEAKPSGYDVEIAKYEKLIQANEKQIQTLEKSITTAETEQKNVQNATKEKQNLLEEVEQWFKANKVSANSTANLEKQISDLDIKANNYSKGGASLQEYQWLLRTEKRVAEIIQIGKDYSTLSIERNELCPIKDAVGETNRLQGQFSGLASLLEKNKGLLSKSQKDGAQLSSQVEKISKELLPALSKLGFNDLGLVQNSILPENKVAELKGQKAAFDKQKIELNTQKKSIDRELLKLSSQDDAKMTLAQLEATLSKQTTEKNSLLQQLGSWKNQLAKNESDKKLVGKLFKELDKMKAALDNLALLNKMIGDKTGSKFANYAQNITLRHLLGLANRRLEHLFERYKLDMPQNEGELMIVDTYQGNIHRGVSTLSGGETFMISLALALSLSDMASKNVALESLFIDEGFSTLDPEMLDLAMTTLDKIQSESQKTVGIISHVESLKERIDVQIQLEKNAQGFSTLTISDGL